MSPGIFPSLRLSGTLSLERHMRLWRIPGLVEFRKRFPRQLARLQAPYQVGQVPPRVSLPWAVGSVPPVTGLKIFVARWEACLGLARLQECLFRTVTLWLLGFCRAQPCGTLAGGHNPARPTGANGTNPERNGVVETAIRGKKQTSECFSMFADYVRICTCIKHALG